MIMMVGDSVYEISREQCDGVLKIASKQVAQGIYAVEKGDIVDIKKERFTDKAQMNDAIVKYRSEGFKVYWNEMV